MNTNRRNFIKTTALVGGVMAATPFQLIAGTGRNKLEKFGFISGIVSEAMKNDWIGTLKKAAEFGFSEIEGGTNYAKSPKEFLQVCNDYGFTPIAGSIDFKTSDEDLKISFNRINEFI